MQICSGFGTFRCRVQDGTTMYDVALTEEEGGYAIVDMAGHFTRPSSTTIAWFSAFEDAVNYAYIKLLSHYPHATIVQAKDTPPRGVLDRLSFDF